MFKKQNTTKYMSCGLSYSSEAILPGTIGAFLDICSYHKMCISRYKFGINRPDIYPLDQLIWSIFGINRPDIYPLDQLLFSIFGINRPDIYPLDQLLWCSAHNRCIFGWSDNVVF